MKILLTILISVIIFGCASPQETAKEPYEYYFEDISDYNDELISPLNTYVKLTIPSNNKKLIDELKTSLIYYHKLFDNYHYYHDESAIINNIKVINDSYGTDISLETDEEIIKIIEESIILSELTHGYFNPFIGALTNTYDGKFSVLPITNTDPDEKDIQNALSCILSFDNAKTYLKIKDNTLLFNKLETCNTKVNINLGAVSKGYIAEILKAQLDNYKTNYLLNIGTSTIISKNDSGYNVGVRSPYNKTKSIFAITLKDNLTLSTSGDDNNFYLLENNPSIIRSHILNPFTGYSENYYRSVTVLSENAMVADVLTTAIFNIKEYSEIIEILDNIKNYYNINIEIALLQETNHDEEKCNLIITKGIKQYILDEFTSENIDEIIILNGENQ